MMGVAALLLVAGAVFWAFWIVGSPAAARRDAADRRRENDLRSLAGIVRSYHASRNELPTELKEVANHLNMSIATDPVTKRSYEYARVDNRTFSLCAVFETDTREKTAGGLEEFERHPKGRHCFILPARP